MRSQACLAFALATLSVFLDVTSGTRRIYGGSNAEIKDYPWHVSIVNGNEIVCGGSIIAEQYVLTAALCVSGFKPSEIEVKYGTNSRLGTGYYVGVCRTIVHPNFEIQRGQYRVNDIAVLELDEPIYFFENASSIPLRWAEAYFPERGVVTGFGKTENGSYATTLQAASDISIRDWDECKARHTSKILYLPPKMICGYTLKRMRGFCTGDVGGALVIAGRQVGIAQSTTHSCVDNLYPELYVSVPQYIQFINDATKNAAIWKD